jgi:hypothetical protein
MERAFRRHSRTGSQGEKQSILLLVEVKHYLIRRHVRTSYKLVLSNDRPVQHKNEVISFGAPRYRIFRSAESK